MKLELQPLRSVNRPTEQLLAETSHERARQSKTFCYRIGAKTVLTASLSRNLIPGDALRVVADDR
jgi:hypothetical protein